MRQPTRQVELDDIISNEILGANSDILAVVLKTHLALEALLIELIQRRTISNQVFRMSFPAKTKALLDRRQISQSDKDAFDRYNDFRNDFAHIFDHKVDVLAILKLARELEANGIDFSDSVGHYGSTEAVEYYGGELGILEEIGWCILLHAAHILLEDGGRDIFSA